MCIRDRQEAFQHKILRHICNTAGIERYPGAQFDMVRLGIGLYGIDPFTEKHSIPMSGWCLCQIGMSERLHRVVLALSLIHILVLSIPVPDK